MTDDDKKPHGFPKGKSGNPDYQFQKGRSGNPGGRPKEAVRAKELAAAHGPEAIERLVHWMRSDNAKASVQASNILIERWAGKVPQAIVGDDKSDPIRFSDVTDEQRAKAVAAILAKAVAKKRD